MPRKKHVAVVMDLNWPYKRHYEIFAGIRDYAEKHSRWIINPGNFPHHEIARGARFDGIVGRIDKDCLLAARAALIPLVNLWLDSPAFGEVTGVYSDSRLIGRMAAEHLVMRGFRRLAYFGFKGSRDSREQAQGMQEVAREHGCTFSSHLTLSAYADNAENWAKFLDCLKQAQEAWEAPLGIAFPSDDICHSVSSICRTDGWRIPEDLAMIGCGNEDLVCTVSEPSLSSIDRAAWKIGYEAARALDRLMRGEKPPAADLRIPPKEIFVRRSTDFHAVKDPRVARALSFMGRSSAASLSVPEIARHVGVGRQTLERSFREHLGRTVNEELIRLRVSMLKRLLVESDESVKELCARVGFGTAAAMFPMFKRHTGLTPKAYRKKHGTSPDR